MSRGKQWGHRGGIPGSTASADRRGGLVVSTRMHQSAASCDWLPGARAILWRVCDDAGMERPTAQAMLSIEKLVCYSYIPREAGTAHHRGQLGMQSGRSGGRGGELRARAFTVVSVRRN